MHKRSTIPTLALLAALLVASGCSSSNQLAMLESELAESRQQTAALQADLSAAAEARAQAESAAAKATEEAEAARMAAEEAQKMAVAAPAAPEMSASMGLLPPNAEPGMCYSRVYIPPQIQTTTERVTVREAGERIETIPAVYETAQERVLVKEESTEIVEVVPATYEWQEERILVSPASYRLEEVPAVYETVSEQILVKPAQRVWKPSQGRIYGTAVDRATAERVLTNAAGEYITRVDTSTGDVMCLVEEPAEYRTVERRVLKSPATTRRIEIPAEYETVRRQVMLEEPRVVRRTVPAVYETRTVKRLVKEAGERRIAIPAEYGEVTKTEVVAESRAEWMPVLCEVNITQAKVRELQRALQSAGHYGGPIDGIYGRLTVNGVDSYQKANSLASGGLTLETLESLGVSP